MALSSKDREFMQQVSAYYLSTRENAAHPDGSIRNTALHFGLTRTKIQKILITTGTYSTDLTKKALTLREQGLKLDEIAARMSLSKASVSSLLPYTDLIHNTAEPSAHTASVRAYRAYEREHQKRMAKKGAKLLVNAAFDPAGGQPSQFRSDENRIHSKFLSTPQEIAMNADTDSSNATSNLPEDKHQVQAEQGDLKQCELPDGLIRLHVELMKVDEEQAQILKKLGGVKHGNTISRDLILSAFMPLRSLHYIMQRLFGFQECHLHRFYVDDKVLERLTANNIANFKNLHGVIFTLEEEVVYNYEPVYRGGSFKQWLRKQYTEPYNYWGDDLFKFHRRKTNDREDDEELDYDEEYLFSLIPCDKELYLLSKVSNDRTALPENLLFYEECNQVVLPQQIEKLRGKTGYAKWVKDSKVKYEPYKLVSCDEDDPKALKYTKVRLGDLTIRDGLRFTDNESPKLIERLPIANVLTVPDRFTDARPTGPHSKVHKQLILSDQRIQNALKGYRGVILPEAFTDVLYYKYDYGDSWAFKITACKSCADLVESGIVTQGEFNRSVKKSVEQTIPVLLARDGDMLVEDCGGVDGFVEFLERLNLDPECTIYQQGDYISEEDFREYGPTLGPEDESYRENIDDLKAAPESDEPGDDNEYLTATDYGVPDDEDDVDKNGMTKAALLDWALSLGWHRNDASNLNLL